MTATLESISNELREQVTSRALELSTMQDALNKLMTLTGTNGNGNGHTNGHARAHRGRAPGYKISEATRKRMREAAKARWAARR